MMRLSGWLSAYGWASTSASRINAAAEHQLTPIKNKIIIIIIIAFLGTFAHTTPEDEF